MRAALENLHRTFKSGSLIRPRFNSLIFVDERVTVLAALLGPARNVSQEVAPRAATGPSVPGSTTAAAPYTAGSPRGSPYRFVRRMRPGRRHA